MDEESAIHEAASLSKAGEARRRFLVDSGILTTGLAATPYLGNARAQDAQAQVGGRDRALPASQTHRRAGPQ